MSSETSKERGPYPTKEKKILFRVNRALSQDTPPREKPVLPLVPQMIVFSNKKINSGPQGRTEPKEIRRRQMRRQHNSGKKGKT